MPPRHLDAETFPAADQFLGGHEQNPRADDLQRPRAELILGEDRQVRGELLVGCVHRHVLFGLQDLCPILRGRGTELQGLVDSQGGVRDELVAEGDGLGGLGGLLTDDYDLISIQYHSLKAAEVYDRFLDDAHASEHEDVAEFITQCKARRRTSSEQSAATNSWAA